MKKHSLDQAVYVSGGQNRNHLSRPHWPFFTRVKKKKKILIVLKATMHRKEPPSTHLPPEIVHIITSYLLAEDPAAVFSLARTSKTYYAYCQSAIQPAVKFIKFHDVKIAVPRPRKEAELKEIVNRLIKRLRAADGFGCVRRVFVAHPKLHYSDYRQYDEEAEWKAPYLPTILSHGQAAHHTTQYGQWQETPLARNPQHYREPDRDFSDDVYKPVVKLMKLLPNLTDLIWSWSSGMPPCILRSLRHDQPQCRLHLDYIFNGSAIPRQNKIPWYSTFWRDNRNVMWYRTPSVHSIRIGSHRESSWRGPQQDDPLLRAVTNVPNLKELRLTRNDSAPDRPSGGQFAPEKLSLEALHFESKLDFSGGILYGWSRYIDFSTLNTLKIHGRLDEDVFGTGDFTKLSFPSLRSLSLHIDCENNLRSVEFYNSANTFLLSLPPLAELELEGWHALVSIESLVAYHGPRLRKLKLLNPAAWQFVNEEDIRLIDGGCPSLEELGIPLDRSQNEIEQFTLYMALGSLKNLSTLHIHFEVPPPRKHEILREAMTSSSEKMLSSANMPLNDPAFTKFQSQTCANAHYKEHQLRNGHVERIIVNAVVDQKLACEIFRVISDAKPLGSVKLKDLRISTSGSNYGHSMAWIVDTFTTAWQVRQVRANSCGRKTLIVAEELQPTEKNSGGRYDILPEWIEPIFQRLFPGPQCKGPPRKTSKKLGSNKQHDDESKATWRRQLRSAVPHWTERSSLPVRGKGRREMPSLRSGKASWGMPEEDGFRHDQFYP